MAKELTKEDVIQNKKNAIKTLNKLLEQFINDKSAQHLKKADLISYWIKDYVGLISFEEKFDPTKNLSYKRGNILKLNFGFNIGSEYGGLHYGIVLDTKNDHNSSVVTVIPLTSSKDGKKSHSNNVELGNELYRSLKLKYDTISKTLKEQQEEIAREKKMFDAIIELARSNVDELSKYKKGSDDYAQKIADTEKYIAEAESLKKAWVTKAEANIEKQTHLAKIGKEISRMKKGSVALINQITTVSKQRIFDPRNLKGVLAGVSLSEENMKKINQKVKDLYIF